MVGNDVRNLLKRCLNLQIDEVVLRNFERMYLFFNWRNLNRFKELIRWVIDSYKEKMLNKQYMKYIQIYIIIVNQTFFFH